MEFDLYNKPVWHFIKTEYASVQATPRTRRNLDIYSRLNGRGSARWWGDCRGAELLGRII